jgi:hypothetical protein
MATTCGWLVFGSDDAPKSAAARIARAGFGRRAGRVDVELVGPDSSVAFWRLSHTFFVGAEYAFAVLVAALSLLVFAGFALPRWLGWTGVVIAVLLLVVPVGWVALLFLVPLWLILVSVTLFRREPALAGVVV